MQSFTFPRANWLSETNLQQDYCHSIAISLLRGLAAVEVVAAHLRAQLYPSLKSLPDPSLWYQVLAFFTGFSHQAVVIFFVLSGWLVGGSLLNKLKQPMILLSYAIDRLTRLWIVLVPAFLLTLVFAIVTDIVDWHVADFSSDNPYSVAAFAGNLFGVQDIAVPRFGENFALWSLAYESWYYVMFPLLLLPLIATTRLGRLAAACIALLLAWHLSVAIVLYFGIWMLGVLCSRIRIAATPAWLALACIGFAALAVYFRFNGSNDILIEASFPQDLVYSAAFLLVLCSLQFRVDRQRSAIRLLASAGQGLAAFSFTLYVIHVPLLMMMRRLLEPLVGASGLSPDRPLDFAIYLGMLFAIIWLAYLFHLPFEARTNWLRGKIRRVVFAGRPARPQNVA
jgi:peptidoglycan/LPS O-acetylase OafA/YrhL